MTLSAGVRVGPYTVVAPLGTGGMGEVYRARDERLSRDVALKVLPADLAGDLSRLKRFEKEARSASALSHPNIVTIYDVGSSESVSYIAMEMVDGKTLREVIADGPLPPPRLLRIATQIAEGLARAHDVGIVHRDLKPENVMVTRDGLVKILDFGLAKLVHPDEEAAGSGLRSTVSAGTRSGIVVGTAGYMSPEQASGHPIDFRADQFSLGAVLYEMATGRRAFARATAVQTLAAIIEQEPEPPAVAAPDTPVPLLWVIDRCLSKDPDARYASTKDLARDLATIRDRLAESSSRPAGWTPASGPVWRSRAIRAALSVALLAAGLLLGRTLARTRSAAPPSFHQVTFRDETIQSARFAPDGQTLVYGTVRQGGPFELFSTRVGSLDSRPLGLAADVLSISAFGEMAVLLGGPFHIGTLASVPLAGGAPREILTDVRRADWSPDGRTLVAVHRVNGRERLESPIGNVLFESSERLGSPRFARSGNRILFEDGGSLEIVDPTRKVTAVRETLSPSGYDWSPDGTEVWMTVIVGSTTEVRAIVPGASERLVAAFPGMFFLEDVAANGRVLATRSAPHGSMLASGPGGANEKDLSWLDASVPADVSADGGRVLFTEAGVGGGESQSVFLRGVDDASAVRLGGGRALALSPDGKWALARRAGHTILLPTGAGAIHSIGGANLDFDGGGAFLSNDALVLSGSAPGHASRLYLQPIPEGEPRPVSADGVVLPERAHTVSPDGTVVAATDLRGTWSLYPLDSRSPRGARPIAGLGANEKPVRWSADGRWIYVLNDDGTLSLIDPTSGVRRVVRRFRPQTLVIPTPDGTLFVYGSEVTSSHLFLVEGLR